MSPFFQLCNSINRPLQEEQGECDEHGSHRPPIMCLAFGQHMLGSSEHVCLIEEQIDKGEQAKDDSTCHLIMGFEKTIGIQSDSRYGEQQLQSSNNQESRISPALLDHESIFLKHYCRTSRNIKSQPLFVVLYIQRVVIGEVRNCIVSQSIATEIL